MLHFIVEILLLELGNLLVEEMFFVDFSLANDAASGSKFSFFIKNFFFRSDMLPFFILKHVAGCNFSDWLFKKFSFREDKMNVIVRLSFVMVKCRDALYVVSVFE